MHVRARCFRKGFLKSSILSQKLSNSASSAGRQRQTATVHLNFPPSLWVLYLLENPSYLGLINVNPSPESRTFAECYSRISLHSRWFPPGGQSRSECWSLPVSWVQTLCSRTPLKARQKNRSPSILLNVFIVHMNGVYIVQEKCKREVIVLWSH